MNYNDIQEVQSLCSVVNNYGLSEIELSGWKIQNRNRRDFRENSPVHKALYRQRNDILKLLIEKLSFRPDSTLTNEKCENVTPAHIAIYNGSACTVETLLSYKPDLTIRATLKGESFGTWTGTVDDFIKRKDSAEINRIYGEHLKRLEKDKYEDMEKKLKELSEEKNKLMEEKNKIIKDNENKEKEKWKILKDEFGIPAESLDILGKKKAELKRAEELTNVKMNNCLLYRPSIYVL